jgi:ATP-dependent helicase/DNAse subunit B
MPSLSLIVGPPNSGKAGHIRARLEAALGQDPVLVVPTFDDVDRFERELCDGANGGAVLGTSIMTFERLFDDVSRSTGAALPPMIGRTQALHVARRASAETELRVLGRSARRPGFAAALSALIDEVQAAGLDPMTIAANAAEAEPESAYLRELATLYASYVEIRDRLGFGDGHVAARRATAALRADPTGWGGRPVLFYGFDDLTVEQLELVAALAEATEVSFAVAFEERRSLDARASLLERLRDLGGVEEARLESTPENTDSATLHHLERWFLRDDAGRIEPDDGLALLEAAGERGQVEQIGVEVARLLAAGIPPDRIAIVLRNPDRDGPLYESVLGGFGIPVAVEARVPLARTATGRGLLGLLRATLPEGTAGDVLAFVRAPGVGRLGDADWLERAIRRGRLQSADEAREAWNGRELFELDELSANKPPPVLLGDLGRFARRLAERPAEREAPLAAGQRRLELRAGAAAAAALEELAAVRGIRDAATEALAALEGLEVPLWRGSTEGHVRVTSPYRIRAGRVDYLFVTSLQEGEFPRHDAHEPFLSNDQRASLRLPRRAEPDEEERYLFGVCLSRPVKRVYLCWRSCDEEGAETPRSPFLDDVGELLAAPAGVDPIGSRARRRHLADVVIVPSAAPSLEELARGLAADGGAGGLEAVPGLEPERARALAERLAAVAARSDRAEPGPLTLGAVIGELAGRKQFGASTLEEYALCSYRWFVQHELRPRTIEPDPEPLTEGSAIHGVLERLYREPPAPGRLPRPDTIEAWRRRAAELVEERAAELGLGGSDARSATARARMVALINGLLEREAAMPGRLRPDPELLEASFGERDGDARPPLDLGGVELHGKIDRVDVAEGPAGAGLIRDYKAKREVTKGKNLADEGKLQLQLYALALERLWGRPPLGAVYVPLAGTKSHTPRGIMLQEERDGLLAGLDLANADLIDHDSMREALDAATDEARRIALAMREGVITRDPIDDRCPRYCTFQSICRRERATRLEPEHEAEEEEEE